MTAKNRKIAALYPLSPLQEGMLFHALLAPESTVYCEQLSCQLVGQLEVEVFQAAWQDAVQRHPLLRTGFDWEIRQEPLQIVFREAEIPWRVEDWRDREEAAQEESLASFLHQDLRQGFEFSQPPLLRCALLRTGDERWEFVWTAHHILLDGWSIPLLLKDVFAFYIARKKGERAHLPPLPAFRSYIEWLRNQPQDAAESFWRENLKGFSAPTPLGLDRPRAEEDQEEEFHETILHLGTEATANLLSFSRQRRLTLSTMTQAAWGLLLSRYSGEADVVFGHTVSGRSSDLPGIDRMVGLFINTLPVRVTVRRGESALEFLRRLQRQLTAARQFEHTALPKIQGWSQVSTEQPLFESLLVFENYPVDSVFSGDALAPAGFRVGRMRVNERTNFAISLMAAMGERMLLKAVFDTRRFEAAAAQRLLDHWQNLLEGLLANPDQAVERLSPLGAAERRQLLVEWNATERPLAEAGTFPEIFTAQACRTPDEPALLFQDQVLTYRQLEEESNRLGNVLVAQGVGAEVRVGLYIERSLEMIVGVLGIQKAGAAYVPLDPSYPQDRLNLMLEDSAVSVVLAPPALAQRLPEMAARVLVLSQEGAWRDASPEAPLQEFSRDQLAYVIYTSGSSGRPKGTLVSHRGLANVVAMQRREFGLKPGDRVLQFSSLSFDISVFEIALALGSGAALYLGPREALLPGPELVRRLREDRVTVVVLPPSVLSSLPEEELPGLQLVVVGGEACSAELARRWVPRHRFFNGYGPTETTIWTTLEEVRDGSRRPVIGRPIDNFRTYALDASLEPVPGGSPGELVAGGVGIARGYHHLPGLTAERFVPDPFSGRSGERLYRTGDLVRTIPDGRIDFLGRIDQQVKIRGFRIELGEVETALGLHPAVREAIVLSRPDLQGNPRLVAYLVLGDDVKEETLRRELEQSLPSYMVPSAFIFLDAMPLTPTAKVDRKALPAPEDLEQEGSEGEGRAPRTPTEEVVAGIWAEILGREQVAADADFFALGGHSLYATQVVSRLRSVFKVELPLRALFENSTVAGVAAVIEALGAGESAVALPPITATEPASQAPLSFAQQRLWFLDRFEAQNGAYNIPLAVRLKGIVDLSALNKALAAVMERHESLRTSFAESGGVAVQNIGASFEVPLTVVEIAAVAGPGADRRREEELRQLLEQAASAPFDLGQGPLFRVLFIRLEEDEAVLLITLHHIISDGWSMQIFLRETAALYGAFRGQGSPALGQPALQYRDFAVWQRQSLQGEALEAQRKFWLETLQGAPTVLDLPTDQPRPAERSFRGADSFWSLDAALTGRLRELSRKEGASLFMTLLAAFGILLRRYTGEDALLLGSPIANRHREGLEGVIGFFVNTLVIRLDLEGDPSFRQLLGRVRDHALAAYSHQDLPFEELVSALVAERDLSRPPLFQVCISLRSEVPVELSTEELLLTPLEVENRTSKFDLTLDLHDDGTRLRGRIEYSTDLFRRETIGRFAEHFRNVLDRVVEDPRRKLSAIDVMSPAELHQVVVAWNDTATDYPGEVAVHRLFEEQAAAAPDAVALVWEGGRLTYGELNARANRLAHRLRGSGVGLESRVGILLPRSPHLITALLATVKAGGAYVPFDPNAPQARLAQMMEQSGVRWLITDSSSPKDGSLLAGDLVDLEHEARDLACLPEQNLGGDIPANALAYVIYTSGSTGLPKGVAVEHRSVIRLVKNTDYIDFGPQQVFVQLAPAAFDASTLEVWGPLTNGGRLVLAPQDPTLEDLGRVLVEGEVTTLFLTTALFHLMVEERLADLVSVSQLMTGGEVVSVNHARRVLKAAPDLRFMNVYGPTENTTFSTYQPLSDEAGLGHSLPIGKPIANTRTYVLDRFFRPLPVGVPGELYTGGVGVARGYLDAPRATAEKFLPDPFAAEPGGRLYRTGDRARYLPDGALDFLGRRDHQVKLRGFRVEPAEIEAALASHPAVQDCLVVVRRSESGGKMLVAFLVVTSAEAISRDELVSFLGRTLPPYMVPSAFVTLDAMPLTVNGKIDRQALAALEVGPSSPVVATAETETERILQEVWKTVLRIDQVGIHDNFFEMGGDSILSLQIIAKAAELGLTLRAKDIFEHQTIQGLAGAAARAGGSRVDAEQGLVHGEVPLLPIQCWFLEAAPPQAGHFNQSLLLEIAEGFDPDLLRSALAAVVRHHDALRLRFRPAAEGWRQEHVAEPWTAAAVAGFTVRDLSGLPEVERSVAVAAEANRLQAELDLEAGPLLQAAYFAWGEGGSDRLFLTAHHLVVDAVSWPVLLQDLLTAYQQLSAAEEVRLPPKTTSYKAWARRLAELGNAEQTQAEVEIWAGEEGRSFPCLPTDREQVSNTYGDAAAVDLFLDENETVSFLELAPAALKAPGQELLLAAVARALSSWCGGEGCAVHLEGHGREPLFDDVDLSRTVGWFTSLFPVYLAVAANDPPALVLRRVKESLRGLPRRGIGFGLLRYGSADPAIRQRLAALPVPEVSLNYLGQVGGSLEGQAGLRLARESVGAAEHPANPRAHLLDINGAVHAGRLALTLRYNREVHEEATIAGLGEAILGNLRSLLSLAHTERAQALTVSDFPLMPAHGVCLEKVVERFPALEDLYRVTPIQEGMLFHSQAAALEYVVQIRCSLRGTLESKELRQAWNRVLTRHGALRTAFLGWQDGEEPFQAVIGGIEVPWQEEDWRSQPPEEQERRIEEFVIADRRRGFNLAEPPLLRLCLMRVGDEAYALVCTFHHLVLDGWSLSVAFGEVFQAYGALLSGTAVELPRPRSYRDYLAWLAKRDGAAAAAFWRQALAGFETPTQLPMDVVLASSPRAPEDDVVGLRLPVGESAALQDLAQRYQLTLNTLLQASWALLLARYSGRQDVVFGATTAGRPPDLSGVETMVGLFINSLPVRVTAAPDEKLEEWLRRLQQEQMAARQFEYSPLVDVQGWSQIPRQQPLFQSLLVFENYPLASSLKGSLGGLRVIDVVADERAHFPLTVIAAPGEQLAVRIAYHRNRFDRSTVRRLLAALRRQLAGFVTVAAEHGRLREVPFLASSERHQVLVEWNDTATAFGSPTSLQALLAAQARRTPDAVAVSCDTERWTYAELDGRARRLARRLRQEGVGPETLVGVFMERSLALVETLCGVLHAGAAYVPLDPSYPVEYLRFVLSDCEMPVLLLQEALRPRLPATDGEKGPRILAVDGPRQTEAIEAIEAEFEDVPLPALPTPDAAAYMIYTSGSTGRPKGVVNSHRGLFNRLQWMQGRYGLSAGDRVLQKTPYSFDVSVWEFFLPLITGAELVVARPEGHKDPAYLVDLMERRQVTVAHFVPSMLSAFLQDEGVERCSQLRQVIASGEALPPAVARRFGQRLDAHLDNLYGPTEAAIDVTYWRCREGAEPSVPIGWPVSNTEILVLDRGLGVTAPGAVGEICIGGVQLARGYFRRPGLTAQRFVPHPFAVASGERLYRTGDLGRFRQDGAVDFLGRLDSQVKVRGFRIELGEVEEKLRRDPAVADAVVMARGTGADVRLVAYVVAATPEGEPQTDPFGALKARLREEMPEFMVPSAFVSMDALPVTASGKLDRRALPEPDAAGSAPHEDPATATEEALAAIWRDVLGLEGAVGRRTDFFEIGGHSLLATRVAARLQQRFQVEVPVTALFETSTLAAMAERVDLLVAAARGQAEAPPLVPVARSGDLPLSFAQQRLWFLDQLAPDLAVYNLPTFARLRGSLDVAALEASWTAVVERHEVLRTTFLSAGGEAVAVIAPPAPWQLEVLDLAHLDDPEAAAAAAAQQAAARPFDLERGPLLRTLLLRLGALDHLLVVVVHHIASDGWSTEILFRELGLAYDAALRGAEPQLPALPVQYVDFAAWQRKWLSGEARQRQIAFWRDLLAGAPEVLELPTDRPRSRQQRFLGDTVTLSVDHRLASELGALARSESATLFMALLASFMVLLHRISGQRDLVVGSPSANRNRVELEGLIGFFVNALALRTEVRPEASFREVLRAVRSTVTATFAHQELPFEELVAALHPRRDMSHMPIFQVFFAFQESGAGSLDLPQLTLEPMEIPSQSAKFDLTLEMIASGGALGGRLEFNTDLFDRTTAQRIARYLETVWQGILANPEGSVGAYELLSVAERAQILVEWNLSELPYDRTVFFHQRFAGWAEETEDALAVVFDDRSLTYGELDREANRLAHHLRSLGVGWQVRVGLCLNRGPRIAVAMLATLKAGGAYVPLDPAYPAERLELMIEDADLRVLISEEALLAGLPATTAAVLSLDRLSEALAARPCTDPGVELHPQSLAYVIYTSGSTGRPKGVMVRHQGVANLMAAMEQVFVLGPQSQVLQFASFSFDASTFDLIMALAFGATLHFSNRDTMLPGPSLNALLRERKISHMTLPPSSLAALPVLPQTEFPDLETIVVAGEPCLPELVDRWAPGRRFYNAYGPTESTIWSTVSRCEAGGGKPTIGGPIANTRAFVVDRALRAVPLGVAGELGITGDSLASGYLHRPALTAERFVPDPFSGGFGRRLYHSGDLARRLVSGEVDFLGRIDYQVKLRGFRIELGEIEAALEQLPAVSRAIVQVVQGGVDRQLVAWVSPAPEGKRLETRELATSLAQRLPAFMVPQRFVSLETMPLLPNGKIDRRALPLSQQGPGDAVIAPRTPTEGLLAGIFRDLLNLDVVSVEHDFFELGGHSLLATRIISRIRDLCGVELPVRSLFEAPTVAGLALQVDIALQGRGGLVEPPILPVARNQPLPLSFAQERLWFLHQLDPLSVAYNLPSFLELKGPLEVAVIERVMTEIRRRHEILRTRIDDSSGEPWQLILPATPFRVPVVDLERLEELRREAEAQFLAVVEARRPFDLRAGDVLRMVLVRLSESSHHALLSMHHIASDGWSTEILTGEIGALYQAYRDRRPSPLPELAVQYGDFSHWQRGWLQGEVLDRHLGFWRQHLGTPPAVLRLPLDRARPAVPSFLGGRLPFSLMASTKEGLDQLCRQEAVTVFMALLAALEASLYRLTDQSDFIVGVHIAQRNRSAVEGLIGFFVNMLALRLDASGQPTFRELLRQARQVSIAAFAHQDLPFERVVQEVQPNRDLTHSPLFQVALNFTDGSQRQAVPEQENEPLRVSLLAQQEIRVRFDLMFNVHADREGIRGSWDYSRELFDEDTIATLQDRFARLLEDAVRRPDLPIAELHWASEDELRKQDESRDSRRSAALRRFKGAKPETAGVKS